MNKSTKDSNNNDIVSLLELSDAYRRYQDKLEGAGMSKEHTAFLLGRLAATVQDEIMKEAVDLTKDEKLDFSTMGQEEVNEKLDEIFENEKGLDLKGYADFLTEQKVREFENLGD